MKHTLTLAILLLAATGRGQSQTNQVMLRLEKMEDSMKGQIAIGTSPPPVAVVGDFTMSTNLCTIAVTDKGIRRLAAEGRICEVFGHCWERLTPETQSRIALYQNGREVVPCKCRICGKEETRTGDYK